MTDSDHFEAFMRAHQNLVYTTALRLLANQAEAEDVSQEVFLKAYRRFADLRNNPAARAWLRTVATNQCLNHLTRYRARWRFFSEIQSTEDEDGPKFDPASEMETAEQADQADRRSLIEAALRKLPPSQRVPLVLFHFHGETYDEIATKLGISLSKLKTDMFRGRQALKKKLQLTLGDRDGR